MQTPLVKGFLADYSDSCGEFPRVVSVTNESEELHVLLEVHADLDSFRGHFPGNPVLAGIVQLHWAARFSSELFNFESVPMEIKRLKFKNVVQPPATLTLTLRKSVASEIQFEFTSTQRSHSSGVLVFEHQSS